MSGARHETWPRADLSGAGPDAAAAVQIYVVTAALILTGFAAAVGVILG